MNGGSAIAFEADGQNNLSVDAGTYSVVEPSVTGYATSYSNCSQVVIPLGGTATCTITNDDRPATLIVKKVVVNDDGGTATADDFAFRVNGGSAIGFEADGQNDLTVDAGTYNVDRARSRRVRDELLELLAGRRSRSAAARPARSRTTTSRRR